MNPFQEWLGTPVKWKPSVIEMMVLLLTPVLGITLAEWLTADDIPVPIPRLSSFFPMTGDMAYLLFIITAVLGLGILLAYPLVRDCLPKCSRTFLLLLTLELNLNFWLFIGTAMLNVGQN